MNMSQYRDLFVAEARRHLEEFAARIVRLEEGLDQETVHELFRHAHSLKGMAATMQFDPIAELAHRLEDLLGRIRDGALPPTPALTDILLEGSDLLGNMVTQVEKGEGISPEEKDSLIGRIASYGAKRRAGDGPRQPPPTRHQFRQSDSFSSVRVKTETLDRMVAITGELISSHHRLLDGLSPLGPALREPMGQLASQLRELKDEVFQARMLPFSMVAERFPRLVRDLTRGQDKEATLHVSGAGIELDRGILEKIAEPLVHLLRNAVDHGIEPPPIRMEAGKDPSGLLCLSLTRDRDHVSISVSDDGRGMDPARLTARALEQGVVTADQAAALSPREAYQLVCAPGFSTAETVTDISGRGVGMDAVRSAVRDLGGSLSIESAIGLGSCFTLKLPLTVSIIQALLVECGELILAFPVNAVDRTLELPPGAIRQEREGDHCILDGHPLALADLRSILGMPPAPSTQPRIPVIVARGEGWAVGLAVDRIVGQREIFVKPLAKPFSHLRHVTGGAILGDGRVVFILDTATLAPHA